MRPHEFFFFPVVTLLLLCQAEIPLAQTDLVPYAGNPVLGFGEPGSWDAGWAAIGKTIENGGVYYLFYEGSPDLSTGPIAIGYATSPDGISFTRSGDNPVLEGDGSGFDSYFVAEPTPFVEGNTWILYYNASTVLLSGPGPAIGRATAPGPSGPWTRGDSPVLEVGSSGEWDSGFVTPNSIIPVDSGYVMYYSGGNAVPRAMVGMASSPDGITWTKYDDPLTTDSPYAESDPVLPLGSYGTWDSAFSDECTVRQTATGWEMYYTGARPGFTDEQIGYATSADGINWTRYAGNPLLGSTEPWASLWVVAGSTILIDSTYYLYYTGFSNNITAQMGLATSTPTAVDEDHYILHAPLRSSISQNYPNPFNPSTTIEYTVAENMGTMVVSLSIYNLRGKLIRKLVDGEKAPGDYQTYWNGRDETGKEISSGIYLYTMRMGDYVSTRKMTVLR